MFNLPSINARVLVAASTEINSLGVSCNRKRPKKINSELVNWENYSVIINRELQSFNKHILDGEINSEATFNKFVDNLSEKIYTTATHCQAKIRPLTTAKPVVSPQIIKLAKKQIRRTQNTSMEEVA